MLQTNASLPVLASLLLTTIGSSCAVKEEANLPAPFEPEAAWEEFEDTLRQTYAYVDRPGADEVDEQLRHSKSLALEVPDRDDFRKILHQTALTFIDPHLIVGPFTDDDFNIVMTSADLDVGVDDGIFTIRDVRAGSAADLAGVTPGSVILAIDDVPVADAALLPFGSVLPRPSTEQLSYGATHAANGRRGMDTRKLRLQTGDTEPFDVELPSPRDFARAIDEATELETTIHTVDEGCVGQVRFNNSLGKMGTIDAFDIAVRELAPCHSIIVDLRNTPSGGNTDIARSVIGHFITDAMPYQMHTMPVVERQSGVPRRFVEYALPRQPYTDQSLVVLHGRWTGSMGEGLAIGLHAAAGAVTIGSNMGDLLGGLWNFDLELSGARIDMAGERLFHVDGTPREDFEADIVVSPADRDADGNDPALEAALAHLSRQ